MRAALAVLVAGSIALVGCGENDRSAESPAPPVTTSKEMASVELPRALDRPGPHPRFFFYFTEARAAREADSQLRAAGYEVETTPPGSGIAEWSVIAEGTPDAPDLATAEDEGFIPLAESLGGEFDGNEVPLGRERPSQ